MLCTLFVILKKRVIEGYLIRESYLPFSEIIYFFDI